MTMSHNFPTDATSQPSLQSPTSSLPFQLPSHPASLANSQPLSLPSTTHTPIRPESLPRYGGYYAFQPNSSMLICSAEWKSYRSGKRMLVKSSASRKLRGNISVIWSGRVMLAGQRSRLWTSRGHCRGAHRRISISDEYTCIA